MLCVIIFVIKDNLSSFSKFKIKKDRDYSKINYLYYMDDLEFYNSKVFLYSGEPYGPNLSFHGSCQWILFVINCCIGCGLIFGR